jgi:putative thioredoxin
MIDITLQNFKADLVDASLQQPVLLDIWAEWCGPCKQLGPVLEKLEVEYGGRFVLAKLDADKVPQIAQQLSQMFGVRSIPFCVMFSGGQPVDGFVGAIPAEQIREFLNKHVPGEDEMAAAAEAEEAEALAEGGDVEAALAKLQEAVAIDPGNDALRFDYVKLLLELGRLPEAKTAFAPVASKASDDPRQAAGLRLAALGHWIAACERLQTARDEDTLRAALATNKRDFDARFELAQCLMASGQPTVAMDELLEIVMRDRQWNEQAARKLYVAILELLAPPKPKAGADAGKASVIELKGAAPVQDPQAELVASYRRKLSSALN